MKIKEYSLFEICLLVALVILSLVMLARLIVLLVLHV